MKKTPAELASTVSQMLSRSSTRSLPNPGSGLDGDKKYLGLVKYRPRYFWAVAPRVRRSFEVRYQGELALMTEVTSLPAKTDLR